MQVLRGFLPQKIRPSPPPGSTAPIMYSFRDFSLVFRFSKTPSDTLYIFVFYYIIEQTAVSEKGTVNLLEQISFSGMLVSLFCLCCIVSASLAACMQAAAIAAGGLLENPAKLLGENSIGTLRWIIFLFPLYALSSLNAATPAELLLRWCFSSFMVYISLMDLDQHVILDKSVCLLAGFSFLFLPILPADFANRLLAAAGGGGLMLLLAVLTKGGIGGGDIKLLFALGLWLGSEKLLLVLFFGFMSGGIVSALLLLTKIKKRGDAIAYGPYFALSAAIALLL